MNPTDDKKPRGDASRPGPAMLAWSERADEHREAAHFFARVISADPAYISHGEVQTGLSLDGMTWAPDLEARLLEDMTDMGDDRSLALARDEQDRIVAAAILYWETTPRVSFGILEDMAVDPGQRSAGLGARLSAFIDDEARRRGCRWMFLESGNNNTRAHAFFERDGYREISHTFVKAL